MLINESSFSCIMVGTLYWIVLCIMKVFWPCCRSGRPVDLQNNHKWAQENKFSFQENKAGPKISAVDGMDHCYGEFSSGRLEVLNPMEFLRQERFLPCF